MKTQITMNKDDLVKLISTGLSQQPVAKIKSITTHVVLQDERKEDFKEIIFELEME